ncbi:DUF6912 family protein [Naumannella halotolerans]|uniref:DUF6912 family protein n=1 Tax=Naumannella halotolerans TaxID=993414 RepID=UPI00370D8734
MSSLTAIPLTPEQARELAAGGTVDGLLGHTTTVPMTEAFGLEVGEEAEYVSLLIARAAGLLVGSPIVITAEVDSQPVEPADFGTVAVDGLRLPKVSGVFADSEPARVAAAASAVEGEDLDSAWESPAVQHFLSENDLLWHSRTELGGLIDRG